MFSTFLMYLILFTSIHSTAQTSHYQFTDTAGTGDGTFYTSDGSDGNCGFTKSPTQLFAAFPGPIWTNSYYCGSCINVVGPKGSVVVKVYDQCPECLAGSLDLSPTAFNLIADPVQGRVPISWSFTQCTGLDAEPLSLKWDQTSNVNWFALTVVGQNGPIKAVTFGSCKLDRQSDNSWTGTGNGGTLVIQYVDGTSESVPNVSILQTKLSTDSGYNSNSNSNGYMYGNVSKTSGYIQSTTTTPSYINPVKVENTQASDPYIKHDRYSNQRDSNEYDPEESCVSDVSQSFSQYGPTVSLSSTDVLLSSSTLNLLSTTINSLSTTFNYSNDYPKYVMLTSASLSITMGMVFGFIMCMNLI